MPWVFSRGREGFRDEIFSIQGTFFFFKHCFRASRNRRPRFKLVVKRARACLLVMSPDALRKTITSWDIRSQPAPLPHWKNLALQNRCGICWRQRVHRKQKNIIILIWRVWARCLCLFPFHGLVTCCTQNLLPPQLSLFWLSSTCLDHRNS